MPDRLIDAGYATVRVAPNPFRDSAPGVIEICSVSDCVSPRPDNWIQSWLHNDFGWFNTAEDAAQVSAGADEGAFRLFAYRLYPELFRRGNAVAVEWPENANPNPIPPNFRSLGYDAVSRSETTSTGFDCSPLSCNDLAAEMPANLHCLFTTRDEAVAQAIEEFQQQEVAMRRERREIRRALREDIDALENSLLIANLLATPLLVGAFGLWFHRRRTR